MLPCPEQYPVQNAEVEPVFLRLYEFPRQGHKHGIKAQPFKMREYTRKVLLA